MPEYLAPGVFVEETSFRSKSIEGVSTSTTAFVGPTRSGPVGAITYTFQVSESQAFASVLLNGAVAEQANETTYVPTQDLAVARTYFWRVRAADPTTTGPWSVTQSFKTPVAGSPSPIPPGPGGGADQIDARAITWLEQASADVSGWTITSQVTEVVQSGDQVCVYHTKAGQWPLADVFGTGLGIEGVIMIVARFDGKWYGAGFDWILLDTEHSPNDLESVLTQAQAAAAYPTSTIARVPWNDMVTIKRFLDIGIQTLLIPYVCTVQEAKDAVAYTRYPPAGVRGDSPRKATASFPVKPIALRPLLRSATCSSTAMIPCLRSS